MVQRLQKALAAAGVASRRRAEEMIAAGEVTVNGMTAKLGQSVDPDHDVLEVRGRRVVMPPRHTYVALHKPAGYVTSLRSTHGERTVVELLDADAHLFPVGRLDKETVGLLLLTDDGDWANLVTHPRYMLEKEYEMVVDGHVGAAALVRLRNGVRLPDGTFTAPARVEDRGRPGNRTCLSVTVIEGRKRQIRLMAEAVGHPVLSLTRVRVGPVELAQLPVGRWRHLTTAEVEGIRVNGRCAAASGSTPHRSADRH